MNVTNSTSKLTFYPLLSPSSKLDLITYLYCKFIDIQAILAATDKIAVIHQAHIARIFRREVTWMSDLPKHAKLGGSGGMLPQEIF